MDAFLSQSVKNEVLRYIQYNLDGDLSLEKLSAVSGYSAFHLHRMLKRELSEPLGGYIKRRRMEAAAFLLSLSRLPVTRVGEWVGYNNNAAFTRAFSQVMGCSPVAFRRQTPFTAMHADLPTEYISLDYKIVRLLPFYGLSFPGMFNYFDKSLLTCWQPAADFLEKANIPYHGLEFWGVMYECPNITGNAHSRIDAVVTTSGFSSPRNLFATRYEGGKYAVFRWCAPHHMIREITLKTSAYILHNTPLQFRESHSYVRYMQNPVMHEADYLVTEWYVPVM